MVDPYICHSFWQNLLPTSNDELASVSLEVTIENSNLQSSTFCISILGLAPNIAPTFDVPSTNNKLFNRFM